jgi:hypothetical protein
MKTLVAIAQDETASRLISSDKKLNEISPEYLKNLNT